MPLAPVGLAAPLRGRGRARRTHEQHVVALARPASSVAPLGVPLYPMPPVEQLETMWPFVAAGIRQHAVSASEHLQAGLSKAAKSAVADASATLSETSTSLLDRFMAYWV